VRIPRRGPDILCGGRGPVAHARDGQLRPAVDSGGDQHGLISGEDSLAEGDGASAQILGSHAVGALDTVGLVGEGFQDLAVGITEHPTILLKSAHARASQPLWATYHGQRVHIGRGGGIPLGHDLTGRAGIGAVVAGQTRLVRAHGPSGILLIGGDGDQAGVGREGTGATLDHGSIGLLDMAVTVALGMSEVFQVMAVGMLRVAWGQEEEGGGANGGVDLKELHGESRKREDAGRGKRFAEGNHGRRERMISTSERIW
jgi:hypothetical protein